MEKILKVYIELQVLHHDPTSRLNKLPNYIMDRIIDQNGLKTDINNMLVNAQAYPFLLRKIDNLFSSAYENCADTLI